MCWGESDGTTFQQSEPLITSQGQRHTVSLLIQNVPLSNDVTDLEVGAACLHTAELWRLLLAKVSKESDDTNHF